VWPAVILVFAGAVTAIWAGTAVRAAGHGLDVTDEGFYLLSYRWWNVDHWTFTGAQYVYGPVFALLGHDIAALRIVRLGSVAGAHLIFGLAFMRWLRPRRPSAPPTRLWEAAGAATIVASGGVVYSWLPATPGYNDVVLLGALLAVAAVFAMARHAERVGRVPAWLPFALGLTVVPVVLAKWAALLLMTFVAVAGVVALVPSGPRAVAITAGRALAGIASGAALVHLAVVPLTTAVPPMIQVNRVLAAHSFAIPVLLDRYWTYSLPILTSTIRQYGLLLAAAVVTVRARRRFAQAAAGILGAAALALAVRHAVREGGLGGGAGNATAFVAPLLGTVLVALLVAAAGRLEDARGRTLLGVLTVLPLGYAFGTSNIPLKVSVCAFAAWMAVLIAVITGLDRRAVAARAVTVTIAGASLIVVTCIATGGAWRHPYRGVPNSRATATAPGVPALASVRLDPDQARRYADLRERLAPYLEPAGRPVVALDKMAGIVLLLDGRSVGEAWYAPEDPARTAAGIAAACSTSPLDRAPVLVLNRPLRPEDRKLLAPCGLDPVRDYRPLAPAAQTGDLTVLVPA
jgi:hypothetical protein